MRELADALLRGTIPAALRSFPLAEITDFPTEREVGRLCSARHWQRRRLQEARA